MNKILIRKLRYVTSQYNDYKKFNMVLNVQYETAIMYTLKSRKRK